MTGSGATSGSIPTGSLTDSNAVSVSAKASGTCSTVAASSKTGAVSSKAGAGASNSGVAGSKAIGVQAGSTVAGPVHSGSAATAGVHSGVSSTTGSETADCSRTGSSAIASSRKSSSLAAGISAKLSMTSACSSIGWAGSSMTFGSLTESNSAKSLTGALVISRSTSATFVSSTANGASAIGPGIGVSTAAISGSTAGAGGTRFSTAAPTLAIGPPLVPKPRLVLLKGTAARRTDGSDAFK